MDGYRSRFPINIPSNPRYTIIITPIESLLLAYLR